MSTQSAESISWVDIGINLSNRRYEQDRNDVIQQAADVAVKRLILTGTCLAESRTVAELATEGHAAAQLYSTAGVHPHDAKHWNNETAAELNKLYQQSAVVAVGECGLDFNRNYSAADVQEQVFSEQLDLAVATGLPLFLHERDAFERFLAIYTEASSAQGRSLQGVVHCFTGDKAALTAYIDAGLMIGITGWVCDERRGQQLQELVKRVPEDRLMIETDGPYLLPRDIRPKPKSNRNEPKYLPHIGQTIARLRGQSEQSLAQSTTANACRLFKLTAD